MKCEICHQRDAQTAIPAADGESELYVCRECARQDRLRRHQQSQRTRKVQGLPPGVSMSVAQIGGDGEGIEPPQIVEALMKAFHGMVGDLEQAKAELSERREEPRKAYSCARVSSVYRLGPRLHLEGLHLLGELESTRRAVHALEMELEGVTADGVHDAGHVYTLSYTAAAAERVKRTVGDILEQERNARVRLREELPRVFGDSLCRALAILKNCRLLSPGELFDLLSPLRLAALEGILDGIELAEVEEIALAQKLDSSEDKLDSEARDRTDARRADRVNARFESVMLSESAEGRLQ